jgi:SRSO17 transposase
MPTILEHPEAQALLAESVITPQQVNGCARMLRPFLQRYLPLFARREQRDNATLILEGKLSGLDRKTSEPIAHQAGVPRKPLQAFVGSAPWDDEALMAQTRAHIRAEWADPNAVLVIDGSGFPKKGTQSCGVTRQWCGRLGKVDNCQVGVFLAYACKYGHAPLDRRLFLPKDWALDAERRAKCHVPAEVIYQERWQIAADEVERCKDIPHAWVVGDDEFGKVSEFRAALREGGERYVLDVPGNTLVRDLEVPAPPRLPGRGGAAPKTPFVQAQAWAQAQPASRWQRFEVRGGEKGPVLVEALEVRVQTMAGKRVGAEERLVVQRSVEEEPTRSYHLSNAGWGVPLLEVVRARGERHRVEEVFQEGNAEVGLDHCEVRSWVGWHHHMTLSLLALWFLALHKGRVGGGKYSPDGVPITPGVHGPAAPAPGHGQANRRRDQRRAAA